MEKLGILCHISSLPNSFGFGDFGKPCFNFINFLSKHNIRFWQMLPLNETNNFNCPYASSWSSSFDESFLDLSSFIELEEISKTDLNNLKRLTNKKNKDFGKIKKEKLNIINNLFLKLVQKDVNNIEIELKGKQELINYSYFKTVLAFFKTENFREVNSLYWNKKSKEYKQFFNNNKNQILAKAYIQLILEKQWHSVKKYANKHGVEIVGDLPIYPSSNSYEVFANPSSFKLDKTTLNPLVYGGVPGDGFSPNGQMWGTCVYNWEYLENNNHKFIIDKIKSALKNYNILRLDHFFGYVKHYEWNAQNTNKGKWVKTDSNLFFKRLSNVVDLNNIIVEDLGFDFCSANKIKHQFNLKGMAVLQMLFENEKYLPNNSNDNDIFYLGTHDNNTFIGFYENLTNQQKKDYCKKLQIPFNTNSKQVLYKTLKIIKNSNSNIVILQIQDLLKQGSEYRMNIPGQAENCWEYIAPKNYQRTVSKTLKIFN